MHKYFNYLSQEDEDIATSEDFYLLPTQSGFKFVVSPQRIENIEFDAYTRINKFVFLTRAQVNNNIELLFTKEDNSDNYTIAEKYLSADEVKRLFGMNIIKIKKFKNGVYKSIDNILALLKSYDIFDLRLAAKSIIKLNPIALALNRDLLTPLIISLLDSSDIAVTEYAMLATYNTLTLSKPYRHNIIMTYGNILPKIVNLLIIGNTNTKKYAQSALKAIARDFRLIKNQNTLLQKETVKSIMMASSYTHCKKFICNFVDIDLITFFLHADDLATQHFAICALRNFLINSTKQIKLFMELENINYDIEKVMAMLGSDNEIIRQSALIVLNFVSKHQDLVKRINSKTAIISITEALTSQNPEIQKFALSILNNIINACPMNITNAINSDGQTLQIMHDIQLTQNKQLKKYAQIALNKLRIAGNASSIVLTRSNATIFKNNIKRTREEDLDAITQEDNFKEKKTCKYLR